MRTPVGDNPGDNCQRLRATRSDWQLAYPQLERLMEVLSSWSDMPTTSLTRKRSLVQSQYRPPVQPQIFEYLIDSPRNDWVTIGHPTGAGVVGACVGFEPSLVRAISAPRWVRWACAEAGRQRHRGGVAGSEACRHEPHKGMGPIRTRGGRCAAWAAGGTLAGEPLDLDIGKLIRAQIGLLRRSARRVPRRSLMNGGNCSVAVVCRDLDVDRPVAVYDPVAQPRRLPPLNVREPGPGVGGELAAASPSTVKFHSRASRRCRSRSRSAALTPAASWRAARRRRSSR